MRRLDGPVDRLDQLGADRVDLDRVTQARGERRDHRLGVVAGSVEAAIHEALDADAQRIEERGGHERRCADADAPGDRERVRRQRHEADEGAADQRGQDRVGERPAHDPVDLEEAVTRREHPPEVPLKNNP